MDTTQKLIITDNKVMAHTIATTFGYTEDDCNLVAYSGDNIEVLWTGGALLDLKLKVMPQDGMENPELSAEDIARTFFRVEPRKNGGQVSYIDNMRLESIERALSYSDEVIFMCQPTDEGERLIQAIKMFFDIQLPTHTVYLDIFNNDEIEYVVGHNNYTDRVSAYRAAESMKNILLDDFNHIHMIKVGDEEVSPLAFNLLNEIHKTIEREKIVASVTAQTRKYRFGKLMDIDRLYIAMTQKYDMCMESLWDSLVWLYGEGLISNPMTRLAMPVSREIYYGMGCPTDNIDFNQDTFRLNEKSAIIPQSPVNESLLVHPYDHENAPDDFWPRTSAIYRFIVEQYGLAGHNVDEEDYEYPPIEENPGLPLIKLEGSQFYLNPENPGRSIRSTIGSLLDELLCAWCVEIEDGIIHITDNGKELLGITE